MADINEIKRTLIPFLRKYNIQEATKVGSVAWGDDTPESDVEIAIKIERPISFLAFSRIKIELEEALQRWVDLIERTAIKARLRRSLLENECQLIG